MLRKIAVVAILLAAFTARAAGQAPAPVPGDQRPADRDAIRAHIMSIFDGFKLKDRGKLRDTHAEHWRGLLIGSRSVIRGIDEYMRYIEPGLTGPPGTVDFVLSEFDVLFYGDVAVVNFVADAILPGGNQPTFIIMDIYTKQPDGHWIQSASHTAFHPERAAAQLQESVRLSESGEKRLRAAREALWRAWFANDVKTLEQMLPDDTIAINAGDEAWAERAAILEGSKGFAGGGNKLVRLEFPKTEIRMYGYTAIIYTTYLFETESSTGERNVSSGRATEVFVLRDGHWVNPGWHMDSGR
ncbi:MAG: DUF4440 domain-containing protein [Candidatus Acidiferrales bacterium]